MTMAKGIANGLPLAATLATAPIADSFKAATISTFGGNPVSCAAASAVLDGIKEDNLLENARVMGNLLKEGLLGLQKKYPKVIGDVRGRGLMLGVELVKDETQKDRTPMPEHANRLFEETKKRGLLIGKGGLYGNAIRIAPALNIGKADIEEGLKILDESFATFAS
jgi:4-aminobutyrate aminotransferase-like enzyme